MAAFREIMALPYLWDQVNKTAPPTAPPTSTALTASFNVPYVQDGNGNPTLPTVRDDGKRYVEQEDEVEGLSKNDLLYLTNRTFGEEEGDSKEDLNVPANQTAEMEEVPINSTDGTRPSIHGIITSVKEGKENPVSKSPASNNSKIEEEEKSEKNPVPTEPPANQSAEVKPEAERGMGEVVKPTRCSNDLKWKEETHKEISRLLKEQHNYNILLSVGSVIICAVIVSLILCACTMRQKFIRCWACCGQCFANISGCCYRGYGNLAMTDDSHRRDYIYAQRARYISEAQRHRRVHHEINHPGPQETVHLLDVGASVADQSVMRQPAADDTDRLYETPNVEGGQLPIDSEMPHATCCLPTCCRRASAHHVRVTQPLAHGPVSARLPSVPSLNTDQAPATQVEQQESGNRVLPAEEARTDAELSTATVDTESTVTVRATLAQVVPSQAGDVNGSEADALSLEITEPRPVTSISGSVENLSQPSHASSQQDKVRHAAGSMVSIHTERGGNFGGNAQDRAGTDARSRLTPRCFSESRLFVKAQESQAPALAVSSPEVGAGANPSDSPEIPFKGWVKRRTADIEAKNSSMPPAARTAGSKPKPKASKAPGLAKIKEDTAPEQGARGRAAPNPAAPPFMPPPPPMPPTNPSHVPNPDPHHDSKPGNSDRGNK